MTGTRPIEQMPVAGSATRAPAGPGHTSPEADLERYADRAVAEALDAGLERDDLEAVLRGRLATELVPPHPGEDPGDYADRAVSELLYFGSATPEGRVSAEDWSAFLAETVTPRFPDGLTAWPASGQWRGKAGAYGIQGIAGCFVQKLTGSYTNVVGLPLYETASLLAGEGFEVTSGWQEG